MNQTQRPNILYLHSHDTGRYVQPYGHAVETPNYQRLAEEGILFRQAFSAAPTCSPSRAALLTGQAPHSAGMIGLAHRGFRLNDPVQHLATTLRDHGYRTVLAGVQHVTTGDPRTLGYDEVLSGPDRDPGTIASAAVTVIRQAAGESGAPFFLDVGFNETHRPFPDVDDAAARYVRPPAPFPDTPETRRDMAAFHADVRRLDAAVGRVLDALDETGLAASTLVMCTTDHGLAFPAMKCNLTDHGTGVLLILRGPAPFTGGQVFDALVSQIDLYPTLCDLLGIDPPAWLQGRSLLPLLRGEIDRVNDHVFAEVTYHAAYEPQRAVRTDRWCYIRRFDAQATPVLPNCDESPTRDLLLEHGWEHRPLAPEQLYDVIFDPNQVNDLAADPDLKSVREDLRQRLQSWMIATDDPLLEGPVPLPPGAMANPPEGRSPLVDDLLLGQPDGSVTVVPNPATSR
jgi:arylsulfatase A-like enzyme